MALSRDLRDWIALLEHEGELVRVEAEVDPDLEVTEIVDRTVKVGGPALLFERPKGAGHPLLINQFGTERRMCLAFGVERLDDVARKVSDVLEMQPPSGQIHKDGRADWLATDGRIPVAVALGLDPITAYSASAPLPKHIDEFMMAGFLRGAPVELVKGVTVDLEVPANAEIVLEGYIEKDELGDEGPFGDHTGYYTAAEPFPVFHVSAMTMRRDAIYPSIVVGKPPQEDAWLGKATERIFLPAIRATVPEIVDYDLPVAGAFHNCCIVSIRKAFPGHGHKAMHAIWGLGRLSLTKRVVVVDEHVDVHDYAQVLFYAGANVDPARDVVLAEGPLDHLDHAPVRQFVGGKLGIDATAKLPEEGARPWPEELEMSSEIRSLVAGRWSEYGIELVPPAESAGFDKTSRSLRQLL